MYIQKAKIQNIKSIVDFEIEFKNPPGWHVLIGDNGAGKSTIIRSIALALVGDIQAEALRQNWNDWLNKKSDTGSVRLDMLADGMLDHFIHVEGLEESYGGDDYAVTIQTEFLRLRTGTRIEDKYYFNNNTTFFTAADIEDWTGFFSAAYGPFRRFKGGNLAWSDLFDTPSYQDLAAHLSVFDESVALTEAITWLQGLNYKQLEKHDESSYILKNLTKLVNSEGFLPHQAKLESISSDGVFFTDANDFTVSVDQMSDGYRSILSMTFELIRQLVRVYDTGIFDNIREDDWKIDVPGVVLIDEIDAHLHPTWQTRIGQWFTQYFPRIQFIVTTHSPLVCRAAENGSIWRLAAPGSDQESGEIIGLDRDRLIYGNVLDAYGTEVFGENVSISEESDGMLNRLAELNVKSMMGEIDESEHTELENLKAVLPTESKL